MTLAASIRNIGTGVEPILDGLADLAHKSLRGEHLAARLQAFPQLGLQAAVLHYRGNFLNGILCRGEAESRIAVDDLHLPAAVMNERDAPA